LTCSSVETLVRRARLKLGAHAGRVIMKALVTRSIALRLAAKKLLARSRRLVAPSSRHSTPALSISGGSDENLRQMVRARLASGALFPVDGEGYAGKGTGQLCSVCGMPILPFETENEISNPRTAYAHVTCHAVWVQESRALRESRG
jgi:hypothetical protein